MEHLYIKVLLQKLGLLVAPDSNLSPCIGSIPSQGNMWDKKVSLCLFLFVILTTIKTEADSSACQQKEKHDVVLDLAKESISKAKDLHPICADDDKNSTSNSSECGVKEKVSAYLDVAMNLIEEARKNYSACDGTNHTKVVLLHKKPVDCQEILENGERESGLYTIWPQNRILDGKSLRVYCDMETDGGGWTLIQRRGNFSQKIDFFRDWNNYKLGFGNLSEEFWIGNDKIFALTNQKNYCVRFDLVKVDKVHSFARYASFWIEDENAAYKLHYGNYTGTAGYGLNSDGAKFSTKDRKNHASKHDCVSEKKGGWWYSDCGDSNPNGLNQPASKVKDSDWRYMNWKPLTNYDPLLSIEIKIRPE